MPNTNEFTPIQQVEQEEVSPRRSAWDVIQTIITVILVTAAVAMMIFTVISVNTFDRSDRDLFGYKAFIVLSDSMSTVNGDASQGYFNAGDLALVKEVDVSTLQAGDIIAYTSTNEENYGSVVTHMIRTVTTDENGDLAFVTYGTHTNTDDPNLVTAMDVLGKYTGHIPAVGRFFHFLKTPLGYIVCIFVPFLLLIGMQGVQSVRLFRQYKAEQMAELEEKRKKELDELAAERQKLEDERKRQEEMMQKLLAMQEAMQKKGPDAPEAPADPE